MAWVMGSTENAAVRAQVVPPGPTSLIPPESTSFSIIKIGTTCKRNRYKEIIRVSLVFGAFFFVPKICLEFFLLLLVRNLSYS